jgi:hypothetical protein
MRALLFCLTLSACAGNHEATDAPLSDAELLSEIMAEAERLNSCDTVDDCEQKSLNCSAIFVNADADQTRLDDLLAEHDARSGNRGCDASCQCGLLRCAESKCVTESGDCMTIPPDAEMVCL